MAFDKVIDSAVLDADLTAVADAIRSKGGTSEPLAFPDGFVNAVEGISAGGGSGVSEQDIIEAMAAGTWPSGDITINGTKVGDHAFMRKSKITGISAPNLVGVGNSTFAYCTALTHVFIPNATLYVGCFEGCSVLNEINVPSATRCFTSCFNNCSALEKIDFGIKMNNINTRCMQNCYALETIILRYPGVVVLDGTSAFDNTPFRGRNSMVGTVYCPSEFISEYQQATNWSALYTAGTCNFVAIEGSEYE